MNVKEYVEKFCNKNYDKLSHDLTWINFDGKKYYENIFPTKSSELFCDRNNNILKYNKVISGSGLEFVHKWYIHNKILES